MHYSCSACCCSELKCPVPVLAIDLSALKHPHACIGHPHAMRLPAYFPPVTQSEVQRRHSTARDETNDVAVLWHATTWCSRVPGLLFHSLCHIIRQQRCDVCHIQR